MNKSNYVDQPIPEVYDLPAEYDSVQQGRDSQSVPGEVSKVAKYTIKPVCCYCIVYIDIYCS